MSRRVRGSAKGGFTLAEVAVTIVIVGIGMLLVLQGLNTAKMSAVQTKNLKLSRELALFTLGQIASGLYQDEIEKGLHGSYAQEGFPDFAFDVAVGDVTLPATEGSSNYGDGSYDSWNRPNETMTDEEKERRDKDPKEVTDQPYEKVKIKVTFPTIRIEKEELKHELVLEQWIPWKQVYGSNEPEAGEAPKPGASTPPAANAPAAGGAKK